MDGRGGAFPIKGIKGIKIGCYARMAEWSKAVDLSPTISGCAGSIPASRIFFLLRLYSSEVEHHTCNVGVSGSIPDEGTILAFVAQLVRACGC